MKEQVLEIIKELFKNGDIKVYVTNEGDSYYKTVTTTVEICIEGELLSTESSTAYLAD